MAKVLIFKDASNNPGANNGDVIATYPDTVRIYTRIELLDLPEIKALGVTDEQAILALVEKICTKEQYLIMTGVFDLIVDTMSLDDKQAQLRALHPEIKKTWLDETTNEWKELVMEPKYSVRYDQGQYKANIALDIANLKKVNSGIVP